MTPRDTEELKMVKVDGLELIDKEKNEEEAELAYALIEDINFVEEDIHYKDKNTE